MRTIRVVEPRVNVKEDTEKNHIVLYGAQRITEQTTVADSYNTTQSLFTINPPSTHTIVDRFPKIKHYIEIKSDVDFQIGTNDGLRQFPIASITDVLTVQINGESISDNIADKIHAMLCYGNNGVDREKSWSMSTAMPDQYQAYADWATYGSARNPLADYGENSYEMSRGGFPYTLVDAKTVRYELTEPLFLSPFLSGLGIPDEGGVNINQFNMAFRYKTNLGNWIWSHSSLGGAITTLTVSFYQAPELLINFLTPGMTQSIPQLQILPYHNFQDFIKTVPTLAPGATTRIVSDSIKLAQIPRRMYLYVRHSRSSQTFLTPNSFLNIYRVNVLWNNQSGLLSSATEQDLYELSVRNGCNLSWAQWHTYRGSVLCIEFGKDIGLQDNEAPGVRGQYTIQIQLDVKNTSASNFDGEFYQSMLLEGTFSIFENGARASLGNLTPSLVLASRESPEYEFSDYQDLQGGGFFNKLKNFTHKVAKGVGQGAKIAEQASTVFAPELTPQIAMLGKTARGISRATGGRAVGGGLSSGRIVSRSQLR